jgi:hypothetical protein
MAPPVALGLDARWRRQYQYEQHHDGGDEKRNDESTKETEPALRAAERCKKTEYNIYYDNRRMGH